MIWLRILQICFSSILKELFVSMRWTSVPVLNSTTMRYRYWSRLHTTVTNGLAPTDSTRFFSAQRMAWV